MKRPMSLSVRLKARSYFKPVKTTGRGCIGPIIMARGAGPIDSTIGEVATTSVVGTNDVVDGMVIPTSVGASGMEDVGTIYMGREGPSVPVDFVEASKENIKDASTSPPPSIIKRA